MKQKELILLYSGGLDSTVLLELAMRDGVMPFCLLIDYGQFHKEELVYAERTCHNKGLNYELIHIDLPVKSKLTSTDESKYEGVSEWHVPSRNLIFIAIAASVAESRGTNLIWYGANYDDREHLFPDCYQEWVFQLNRLLERNGSVPIRVEAPLLGMSKETVQRLATIFNINEKEVFSGYGTER